MRNFKYIVDKQSTNLVKLALRSLAMVSAASYAGDELSRSMNTEDLKFNVDEINSFNRKLIRLQVLKAMLGVYKVDEQQQQHIIELQLQKDFGGQPVPPRAATFNPQLNTQGINGQNSRARSEKPQAKGPPGQKPPLPPGVRKIR